MDVGLNSGQLALRDSVRDVLRTDCPPAVTRQAMTDPERWRTVGSMNPPFLRIQIRR